MDSAIVARVVEKHLKLIGLEEDAERAEQQEFLGSLSKQQLQQRGVAIYGLRIIEQRTGLVGKTVVEFGTGSNFSAHVIKTGDVVQIDRPSKAEVEAVSGIVSKLVENSISVAFKEPPNIPEDGLRIVKLPNDVAFQRMRYAMNSLGTAKQSRLLDVLFGSVKGDGKQFPVPDPIVAQWFNPNLNESQKEAVITALNASELKLIHGPPGTGKTETLIEIIKQLVTPRIFKTSNRKRVLVCGPSNLSVDNIVERLGKIDMVRVGHPARVLESVISHTLDSQLAMGDAAALVKDIRLEINAALKQLSKPGAKRREIYAELKELRKELYSREKGAIDNLISGSSVVLSTLNMAGSKLLKHRRFDVVIIDEAGQALEAECWLAMLLADKVILAGDHCQLPPTVSSPNAERGGLAITLFERLVSRNPETVSLLNIQYRMNHLIMDWSSAEFYHGKLVADSSVANHSLSTEHEQSVLRLIDTVGFDCLEAQVDEDQSKYNEGEAKLVVNYLLKLVTGGISPKNIAVITPYNAQVGLIETLVRDCNQVQGVEIGSGTFSLLN
jgi:superfamily I DNA and/or RNA helicase